jgi:opacity protein-like surface antigen
MRSGQYRSVSTLARVALAAFFVITLALSARPAASAELIPAVGLTNSTNDNSGDSQAFWSLGLRQDMAPFLAIEVGAAYRQQNYLDDNLKVRVWPVTASLWLKPFPILYAGGGVGYYPITFDYADALPIEDNTEDRFGVHVGGGASVPLAPHFGMDLNARYVFLRAEDSPLIPESFDPDFWNASVGLALKF